MNDRPCTCLELPAPPSEAVLAGGVLVVAVGTPSASPRMPLACGLGHPSRAAERRWKAAGSSPDQCTVPHALGHPLLQSTAVEHLFANMATVNERTSVNPECHTLGAGYR